MATGLNLDQVLYLIEDYLGNGSVVVLNGYYGKPLFICWDKKNKGFSIKNFYAFIKIEDEEAYNKFKESMDFYEENYIPNVTKKEEASYSGKWILEFLPLPLSDSERTAYKCSKCGLHYDTPTNYCPNCGDKKVEDK